MRLGRLGWVGFSLQLRQSLKRVTAEDLCPQPSQHLEEKAFHCRGPGQHVTLSSAVFYICEQGLDLPRNTVSPSDTHPSWHEKSAILFKHFLVTTLYGSLPEFLWLHPHILIPSSPARAWTYLLHRYLYLEAQPWQWNG